MELHALHRHGWTISALAREFGLSRNTVRRELRSPERRGYAAREVRTALNDAQQAHIARRIEVCPAIRGTIVYAELRESYGYSASYPAFIRHLRQLRPPLIKDPEIRFETAPGEQIQADWAHIGVWPLHDGRAELFAMVAILGQSRRPALRFALDRTRQTTFSRLVECCNDLGGVTREILTDRDPAFCIGSTSDGRAILAPEWVDLAAVLGVVPRACKPYRAKTKGKVERMVRELKEGFIPWLSGQVLPLQPTLADYDALAARWISEVVLRRRHRTTGQIVGAAWPGERPRLRALPERILTAVTAGREVPLTPPAVIDLTARLAGEHVEVPDLHDYEAAL
jgi:transposase